MTAIETLDDGARGIVFLDRGPLDDPDVGHFVNTLNGGEVRYVYIWTEPPGRRHQTPYPIPDNPHTYFALMIDCRMRKLIPFTQAVELAAQAVAQIHSPHELVIRDCKSYEEGWIFSYQSREWMETQEFQYVLSGNSPVFVSRDGEEVTRLPHRGGNEAFLKARAKALEGRD